MTRPASPNNVAASSAATSAWANSVVDAVNAVLNDVYGAVNLTIPYTAITGVFGVATASVAAFGDAATAGVGTSPSRDDHGHGMPALGATVTTQAVGDAAVPGAAVTPSKSDHKHAMPAFGAVTAQTTAGAASTNGVSVALSRTDHAHGTPAAVTLASLVAAAAYDTPATADGGKRIYVGDATPTGASEGDVWVKQ